MRGKRRKKLVASLVLAGLIGIGVGVLRYLEAPRNVLQHALNLQKLPPSLDNLKMGSDVWGDEVRGFYFDVAAEEFPLLLTGRSYEEEDVNTTFRGTFVARTIHVSPPVSFPARWRYRWQTEGATLEILTDEKRHRVIARFSAN
ncbi:hypothetical protein [Roseibacillus persicicus]|uniref:Uncharacterized protein n=1 Tax=Roseibacillus persicicus TaxID=454148 RepID=A0A918U2N2_9BACT|nr:hypothetical protein [Roseibacillus persicicus]GHC67920.1 hypothetical protein GCM10007100_40060 [Roseibacillus persicicus]